MLVKKKSYESNQNSTSDKNTGAIISQSGTLSITTKDSDINNRFWKMYSKFEMILNANNRNVLNEYWIIISKDKIKLIENIIRNHEALTEIASKDKKVQSMILVTLKAWTKTIYDSWEFIKKHTETFPFIAERIILPCRYHDKIEKFGVNGLIMSMNESGSGDIDLNFNEILSGKIMSQGKVEYPKKAKIETITGGGIFAQDLDLTAETLELKNLFLVGQKITIDVQHGHFDFTSKKKIGGEKINLREYANDVLFYENTDNDHAQCLQFELLDDEEKLDSIRQDERNQIATINEIMSKLSVNYKAMFDGIISNMPQIYTAFSYAKPDDDIILWLLKNGLKYNEEFFTQPERSENLSLINPKSLQNPMIVPVYNAETKCLDPVLYVPEMETAAITANEVKFKVHDSFSVKSLSGIQAQTVSFLVDKYIDVNGLDLVETGSNAPEKLNLYCKKGATVSNTRIALPKTSLRIVSHGNIKFKATNTTKPLDYYAENRYKRSMFGGVGRHKKYIDHTKTGQKVCLNVDYSYDKITPNTNEIIAKNLAIESKKLEDEGSKIAAEENVSIKSGDVTFKAVYGKEFQRDGNTAILSDTIHPSAVVAKNLVIDSESCTTEGSRFCAATYVNTAKDAKYKAAVGTQVSETYWQKRNKVTGSKSWRREHDEQEFALPTEINIAQKYVEKTGDGSRGTVEYEGTIVNGKQAEAQYNKDIKEKTVSLRHENIVTGRSRGICAPKFRGDPLVKHLESKAQTRAALDQANYALLTGVDGVRTVADALAIYRGLATGNMVSVICCLIGRYTTPFGYSSMKMTQQVYGTQEVAGRVELNTLILNNDSSEFCGVWIADHADINTKKMTVTGTKQTVDIENEMSGYSVGFGNVFNPFVTGAVASVLPTYSNFVSDVRQHITKHTPSFVHIKDANYHVDEMHLKNGIITCEKVDGRISVVIEEHLKNRVEQYSHSRSFSINTGAMAAFCMSPNLMTAAMAMPVDRKSTSSSVHENHAKSGMYVKENHISIGKTIEITPTLRNEEKISVFDTAPISSIGSIMSGVQEIKENWEAIREHHHNDIIIDAEPVENEVITEASKEEKPVIAVDADPKKPEKQTDFSIRQDELHDIINEIYDTDIAQYREFDRVGSPDRVETELTKAVEKVQAVASGFGKAFDFSNMPDQIVGADADPQSMVALGKGVMKVVEFAGCILEPIIGAAANSIGTKVRRTLRDDWNVSQAKAQDIGDITHVIAGLLVPGAAAKIWKTFSTSTNICYKLKKHIPINIHNLKIDGSESLIIPNELVGYTKHGLDRVICKNDVGTAVNVVLSTLQNPLKVTFKPDLYGGTFKFISKNACVVINKNGKLVTAWSKSKSGARITK